MRAGLQAYPSDLSTAGKLRGPSHAVSTTFDLSLVMVYHKGMAKHAGSIPSHPVRVEISLRPVAGIAEGRLSDLALYQLKLMASHLQLVQDSTSSGVGDPRLPTFRLPDPGRRTALRRFGAGACWRRSGPGKTIEAGLVLKNTCCARWCLESSS